MDLIYQNSRYIDDAHFVHTSDAEGLTEALSFEAIQKLV